MRVLLWIIGLPLALLLVAALLLPILLDEERLVEVAAQSLEQQTGAKLVVEGGASLSLFPTLGLDLSQASVEFPGEGASRVQLQSLLVGVRLMPLLSQQVEVEQLIVNGLVAEMAATPEQPRANTNGMSDAELDAFYEKRRKALEQAGSSPAQAAAAPLALQVGELSITNARFIQRDPQGGEPSVLELRELQASDLNLAGRPIPLSGVIVSDDPLELVFSGSVRITQSDQLVNLDDLKLVLKGPTAEPLQVSASGLYKGERQIAELQIDARLAETEAKGSLRFAAFESPQIDADLHLNLFDPALIVLAGPEAAESASESPSGEGDGDAPLPLDALRRVDTNAVLRIDRALIDGHEITDIEARLRVVEGVATLKPAGGKVHGGTLQMEGRFDGKRSTAKLTTTGSLQGMDLADTLAAMETDPLLSGKGNASWELQSSGRTGNELVQAMQGPIRIDATDAVLQGIGVEKMLCEVVALANRESLSESFPDSSAFDTLKVRVQLEDGKAKLSPLQAQLPGVSLGGEGRLLLLEQTFSAKFAARLSPELAERDPACRINRRYTDLDWPVRCQGELSGDPAEWCAVDSEEILADLATNEAKRKIEKEAGKLFDKLINR